MGTPPAPIERFATDPELDAVLLELQQGFGPQRWWPAETPFEVMVGAVLVQNTAWRNVELALAGLRAHGLLGPHALVTADPERLLPLLRPSGTYRGKAHKLRELSLWYLAAGGLAALTDPPLDEARAELLGIHGIGPETADAILCYAAGRRAPIAGAYARRILDRHDLFPSDRTYAEARSWLVERLVDSQLVHEEFHALCVRAGSHHCKPSPECETCPATPPSGC